MARLAHRRLRAPVEDGAALIDPPLTAAASLVAGNRQQLLRDRGTTSGKPLADLASLARCELLEMALRHTSQYRDSSFVSFAAAESPFLLAGHQPELFHPGVWFKNFLLSSLAAHAAAVPINLIIDTDAVHGVGIRVPSSASGHVHTSFVPFDAPGPAGAWEERSIVDPGLLASFAERVTAAYRPLAPPKSIDSLIVNRLAARLPRKTSGLALGRALAQARHDLEGGCGLKTLEAPLSTVAQMPSFRRFTIHLLAELASFREIYNASLAEYRHVNRIRSHTHPVPALGQAHDWLEAPYFLWTTAEPRRRAVFVRSTPTALELTDRTSATLRLDASPDRALEQLAAYEAHGVKLRPRALVTTMYARLLLSDAFIHGIGGAKYDELTDLIIARFWRVTPPAYITATATFRLPVARPPATDDDVRAGLELLRALRFRPERSINHPLVARDSHLAEQLAALASEKRDFLSCHDLRRCAPAVYEQLQALHVRMHELLRPVEEELQAQHAKLVENVAEARLIGSREFSFVLFNSEILPARLLDLCKLSS